MQWRRAVIGQGERGKCLVHETGLNTGENETPTEALYYIQSAGTSAPDIFVSANSGPVGKIFSIAPPLRGDTYQSSVQPKFDIEMVSSPFDILKGL